MVTRLRGNLTLTCIQDLLRGPACNRRMRFSPARLAQNVKHSQILGPGIGSFAVRSALQVCGDQFIHHTRQPRGRDEAISL